MDCATLFVWALAELIEESKAAKEAERAQWKKIWCMEGDDADDEEDEEESEVECEDGSGI
jgi:hypothetical protein